MPKLFIIEEEELDLKAVLKQINGKEVKPTDHTSEVLERKGRPTWDKVEECFKNKKSIYKAIKGRKGRIKLFFYLSNQYDLVAIVRLEQKFLYVVTHYYYKKKKRVRGYSKNPKYMLGR
jgi:hypothetical protein